MDTDKATFAQITLTNKNAVTTDGRTIKVESGEICEVIKETDDEKVLLETKNKDKFYMSIDDVLILRPSNSGDKKVLEEYFKSITKQKAGSRKRKPVRKYFKKSKRKSNRKSKSKSKTKRRHKK